MTGPTLSVVIPAYNEGKYLPATIAALVDAIGRSGFDAELVVVDDGSNDGSGDIARAAAHGRIPTRVISQENRGRLAARRAGIEAANASLVLLLDGRVLVERDALRFVHDMVRGGQCVWTGHVHVAGDSVLGTFWRLIAELAWRGYFDEPRTTTFGVEDFDRYPKGTTCFVAPRETLLEAMARFESRYVDTRNANDDTPILRHIAERGGIGVSPRFACTYSPRANIRAFLRHSVHRGVVFVDGHGRVESRFFPVVIAFFPISMALVLAAVRRPTIAPATAFLCSATAAAFGVRARRTRHEIRALALVTPIYALAHGVGMWKGLIMLVRSRVARRDQAPASEI
ncbi:MAG: glycosyltransferase family 2 protein [Gaiellaceae bacterium]